MCQWKVWGGLCRKSETSELNPSNWHQIHPATVGQHPPSPTCRTHFRSKPRQMCELHFANCTGWLWLRFSLIVWTSVSQSCSKLGAILCHCCFSFRAWGAITWPIKPQPVQIAFLKSDSSTAYATYTNYCIISKKCHKSPSSNYKAAGISYILK